MKFLINPKFWLNLCIILAALAHLVFLIAQMFLWRTSFVQGKWLGGFMIEQKAEILAHNQGLYNGFLGAGLLWGLLSINSKTSEIKAHWVVVFFLVCAFIAGTYGSISLGRPTAFIFQSLPGVIALPLIWLANQKGESKSTERKQTT